MSKGKPQDRVGHHAGKWWNKGREMWDKARDGNYEPKDMAKDAAVLAVEGLAAWRSLFGGDTGLPLAYLEITRNDLAAKPHEVTLTLEDDLAEGTDWLNDEVRLVTELPSAGGNPTRTSLPFTLSTITGGVKVTIPAFNNAPQLLKPGIYEGQVRNGTPGNPPTPTGVLFALIKLRLNA